MAQPGRPSPIIIIDYLVRPDSWEILGKSKLNWIFAATLVKEAPLRLISVMMVAWKMRPGPAWSRWLSGPMRRCGSHKLVKERLWSQAGSFNPGD